MKENLSINLKNASKFISFEEIVANAQQSVRHLDTLNSGSGPGNDYLGWMSLPDDILIQLERIEKAAKHLRSVSDTTVVIGIGGSYLGARAVIEALTHSFSPLLKRLIMILSMPVRISPKIICRTSWKSSMEKIILLLQYQNPGPPLNRQLLSEYYGTTWRKK